MTAATVELLQTAPPDAFDAIPVGDARRWCVGLIRRSSRYGSALLDLAPPGTEDDLAVALALIALHQNPARATREPEGAAAGETDRETQPGDESDPPGEPVADWRSAEHAAIVAGETPRHPVFVAFAAMQPDADRLGLVEELITGRAAVPDDVAAAPTWSDLLARDRERWGAAVRLVLDVAAPGVAIGEEAADAGVAIAWTDACLHFGRIAAERNRLPFPAEACGDVDPDGFLDRLRITYRQRHAPDRTLLEESRVVLRDAVERAWARYDASEPLVAKVPAETRPLVWFALSTGDEMLRTIARWNFETAIHEPKLSRLTWWRLRRGARRSARRS